jgi:hypothetical protein
LVLTRRSDDSWHLNRAAYVYDDVARAEHRFTQGCRANGAGRREAALDASRRAEDPALLDTASAFHFSGRA